MTVRPTVRAMFLLPTGNVLIINGDSKHQDTLLYPLLYKPSVPGPLRFEVLTPSATQGSTILVAICSLLIVFFWATLVPT